MSTSLNIESAIKLANNPNSTESDYKKAIEILTQALKTNQNKADIYYNRAVSYLNTLQFDLAVFDFSKLIEIDPNKAFYYSCRAFAKARTKDKKGAIEDYEKALQIEPENPITYNNMGLVQEEIGYMKAAQKSFEQSDDLRKKEEANKIINAKETEAIKNEVEQRIEKVKQSSVTNKIEDSTPTAFESQTKKSKIAKEIFTNKNTFKEFINFIKNGFKLK